MTTHIPHDQIAESIRLTIAAGADHPRDAAYWRAYAQGQLDVWRTLGGTARPEFHEIELAVEAMPQ